MQGWLLHDLFMMHGAFGAPYEFLWANPYQPGLSYFHAPLAIHDSVLGQVFIRSSWDDDARWAGLSGGKLQFFSDGKLQSLDLASAKLLDFDHALVAVAGNAASVTIPRPVGRILLLGLKPQGRYSLGAEIGDKRADRSGVIELTFTGQGFDGTIRLRLQR